ncbi:hypothetical protein Dimus_039117 [Dionaea muscipula]
MGANPDPYSNARHRVLVWSESSIDQSSTIHAWLTTFNNSLSLPNQIYITTCVDNSLSNRRSAGVTAANCSAVSGTISETLSSSPPPSRHRPRPRSRPRCPPPRPAPPYPRPRRRRPGPCPCPRPRPPPSPATSPLSATSPKCSLKPISLTFSSTSPTTLISVPTTPIYPTSLTYSSTTLTSAPTSLASSSTAPTPPTSLTSSSTVPTCPTPLCPASLWSALFRRR